MGWHTKSVLKPPQRVASQAIQPPKSATRRIAATMRAGLRFHKPRTGSAGASRRATSAMRGEAASCLGQLGFCSSEFADHRCRSRVLAMGTPLSLRESLA